MIVVVCVCGRVEVEEVVEIKSSFEQNVTFRFP